MNFRLWYPQLDVYDGIRRIACLLNAWDSTPISPERLCILDLFFSSSPLLHDVNMTQEVRREFQKLRISQIDKQFLSYPSAPILFQKMEEIQKGAIRTLAGKDLIDQSLLAAGKVVLTEQGQLLITDGLGSLLTNDERHLLSFLTGIFGQMGATDIRELRRRTGLRRAIQ